MAASHLNHEDFFSKLATLFESSGQKASGSVFLTQKRFSHDGESATSTANASLDALDDLEPASQLPVIIRATTGHGKDKRAKKVKLSTIVKPEDLESFYSRYAEVCKTGMAGLKKRDRKGRKKDKAKKKKGPSAA